MRAQLRKLATTSQKLRAGVKTASLLGTMTRAVGRRIGVGRGAMLAVGGGLGVAGAVGTAKQTAAKFDPKAQQIMLNGTPVPPGVNG